MLPLIKFLSGSAIAAAAIVAAAPAAAQYYPYGNGGAPTMGNAPGYGYGYGGYNGGQGPMASQCSAAVQARLSGGGYGGGYYPSNGGGRVLGISRVDPRDDGGFTVRGVAASGAYGASDQPDLVFRCRTDFRGMVTDVSIEPAQRRYNPYGGGYGSGSYYGGAAPYGYAQPYGQQPYSQQPYTPAPDDQTPYYPNSDNSGPYGYSRY